MRSRASSAVYTGALALLVVVAPLASFLWQGALAPDVAALLRAAEWPGVVAAAVDAGLVAAVALGGFAGPLTASAFRTWLRATSGRRRLRAFGGLLAVRALLVVLAVALVVGVPPLALVVAGGAGPIATASGAGPGADAGAAAPGVIVCALALGALAFAAWLAGQTVPRRARGPVTGALAAIGVGAATARALVPGSQAAWAATPGGWVGAAWDAWLAWTLHAPTVALQPGPGAGDLALVVGPLLGGAAPAVLASLAVAVGAVALARLERIPSGELDRQARAWDAMELSLAAGEPAGVAEQLDGESVALRGEALAAEGSILRQATGADARALLRAPGAAVASVLALLAGAAAVALGVATAAPSSPRVLASASEALVSVDELQRLGILLGPFAPVLAATGALLLVAGLRLPFAGLDHGAAMAAAPGAAGGSARSVVVVRAVVPALAVLATCAVGALAAIALHRLLGVDGASWPAGLLAASIVLVAGTARAAASVRGFLPLRLLAPITTPAGDPSGAIILVWQLEAAIGSTLVAWAAVALFGAASAVPGTTPMLAQVLTLAAVALSIGSGAVRLRRLR